MSILSYKVFKSVLSVAWVDPLYVLFLWGSFYRPFVKAGNLNPLSIFCVADVLFFSSPTFCLLFCWLIRLLSIPFFILVSPGLGFQSWEEFERI